MTNVPTATRPTANHSSWLGSLWRNALVLTVIVFLAAVICSIVASKSSGSGGLTAVAVAATAVWIGSLLALACRAFAMANPDQLHWHLAAMMPQFAIPFVVGLFLKTKEGPLAEAGVFGWIVVLFLVALVAESLLAVRTLARVGQKSKLKSSELNSSANRLVEKA